jgi:hypothetical protein
MLETLSNRLSGREAEMREDAFQKAHRFIDEVQAAGGAHAGTKKSWPQPPRRDQRRVDIEVHKGIAFV